MKGIYHIFYCILNLICFVNILKIRVDIWQNVNSWIREFEVSNYINICCIVMVMLILSGCIFYKLNGKLKFIFVKERVFVSLVVCILSQVLMFVIEKKGCDWTHNLLLNNNDSSVIKSLIGCIFFLVVFVFILIVPVAISVLLFWIRKSNLQWLKEKLDLKIKNENDKKIDNIKKESNRKIDNIKKESHRKINNLININKQDISNLINKLDLKYDNYVNKYDNEEDITYFFDDNLYLKTTRSKKIFINNDEKLKYFKDMLDNLDYNFNGDHKSYCEDLIYKGEAIINIYNGMSHEFTEVKELLNYTKDKIYFLKRYFYIRNKYLNNNYEGCKAGIEGEEKVNSELAIHTNIINLKNIRLEVLDSENNLNSIENDNILLTRNGIFVLEVKNFGAVGNYNIVIEKDGRWLRKKGYDKESFVMKNVTKQNNRHIAFLNKFINENTNRSFDNYVEAEGIVVIANEKISIENYNDNQNVFRDSEIYSYIKSRPIIFTKEELEEIREVILKNNLEAQKFPVFDYSFEIENNIRNFSAYINKLEEIVKKLNSYMQEKRICEIEAEESIANILSFNSYSI